MLSSFQLSPTALAALTDVFTYLHAHPELSFQERSTAGYLKELYRTLPLGAGVNLEIVDVTDTGFVVVLRHGEGPVVAYRCDLDGLPVTEQTGLPYASHARGEIDGAETGIMHACGHDSHMTVTYGTAQFLAAHPEAWAGTVEFIHQPSEENGKGAQFMVDGGLWDRVPAPEILYGAHCAPLPVGTIVLTNGPIMAGIDGFKVEVRGKGGHGSRPQTTVDPIVLGAAMIMRLQTVISREVSPDDMAVITVGSFRGGLVDNVIPDTAEMQLTTRFRTNAVRDQLRAAITRVLRAEAAASGAPEPGIELVAPLPATVNDSAATEALRPAFTDAFGDRVVELRQNGSEDFALLAAPLGLPYVYWQFGGFSPAQMADGRDISNHSPFYYVDPAALEPAVKAALLAILSRVGTQG